MARTVTVTKDMADYTQMYVDYVLREVLHEDDVLLLEQKMYIGSILPARKEPKGLAMP